MDAFMFIARARSVDETRAVAAALGAVVPAGTTITLQGDLGAGKTHFVQGLAQGLGVASQVTSPTFNILVVHQGGRLPLFHFDLYRLTEERELDDIGFHETLEQGGVACIEWAERFPAAMPEERLELRLRTEADGERTIEARALGTATERLVGEWQHALAKRADAAVDAAVAAEGAEADTVSAVEPAAADVAVVEPATAKAVEPAANAAAASAAAKPSAAQTMRASFARGREFVLAFDTSNETIAIGLGFLHRERKAIQTIAFRQEPAFRASNTKLVLCVDRLLKEAGVAKEQIACVVCGRGPGSFTGVRICLATAKGMAIGFGVPLFGVSTLDAQAWEAWAAGARGSLLVLADAMRKEVYPASYLLDDRGIDRLDRDSVIKADLAARTCGASDTRLVTGDALNKYAELFAGCGIFTAPETWAPTGNGLLLCAGDLWKKGLFDPDDATLGNPLSLLPIYTRLSDAEEHERQRFAATTSTNLVTGVQGGVSAAKEPSADGEYLRFQPLEASWCEEVARMESVVMGSDAWNAAQVADELPRSDRSWWACFATSEPDMRIASEGDARLVGYAGGWIVDGQLQILKIASDPTYRRRGIARELLAHLASDARDLGAVEATLEVRASNTGAHRFYESLGLHNVGKRPRYYSDHEDAFVFTGPLPLSESDLAGMSLRLNEGVAAQRDSHEVATALPDKLILAIESSCDETAVAIVDGEGTIVADVVASQIDFHSRFGGVVPEIASRKHIEAIGGVVEECLRQARESLGAPQLGYRDLTAVGVTFAPGLVGALVVGLAFAKGLAWSCDLPLVTVNHLEGHLYANRIARPDIQPPMVVSLVSGGHTMLVHVKDWGDYETMGSTLDDAVGEAFDKVAKAMGLGYPGGPLISKLAETGDPKAIRFPRAMLHSGDLTFSLSGLKTAVMTYLDKERKAGREPNPHDVAASFQAAVVDVQVAKAAKALEQTGAKEFCLGGGVAANPVLRTAYEEMCANRGVRLTMPPLSACGDNAAMIALVALERFDEGKLASLDCDVRAHAPLDEAY